jgi:hypothetical protein
LRFWASGPSTGPSLYFSRGRKNEQRLGSSQACMEFSDYVSSLSFRFLQPGDSRAQDGNFWLPRSGGDRPKLLELPYQPVDLLNTRLAEPGEQLKPVLREVCEIPRMSTFAVAAIMNYAVARMPAEHVFLNVGVWNGFSFLSGLVNNPDKTCIGVDNFSESGGPRDAFMERFERFSGPNHRFHEMDYRDYFSNVHSEPIGVYFYDGEHSYENQWRGLEIAEPYFTDDCILFVDDTNWDDPHRATLDFIDASERDYTLFSDERTAGNGHPTLWNGLMVAQVGAGRGALPGLSSLAEGGPRRRQGERPAKRPVPGDGSGDGVGARPLVSVVVVDERGDAGRLEAAVESALDQTWSHVEVLAVSPLAADPAGSLGQYGDRVELVPSVAGEADGLMAAVRRSNGPFVSFMDVHKPLRRSAVHMALGFPGFSRFWRNPSPGEYEERERMLQASEELAAVMPPGKPFAIVAAQVAMPRTFLPNGRVAFPQGGGEPPDDESAMRDLEQLRGSGAALVAFLWPAFWWLDRYSGLASQLRSSGRCVLENERVVAFDLQ